VEADLAVKLIELFLMKLSYAKDSGQIGQINPN
jgi:hypothetical protein